VSDLKLYFKLFYFHHGVLIHPNGKISVSSLKFNKKQLVDRNVR